MSDFVQELRSCLNAIQRSFSVFDRSEALASFAALGDFVGKQCSSLGFERNKYLNECAEFKKEFADYWVDNSDFKNYLQLRHEVDSFVMQFSDLEDGVTKYASDCTFGMGILHALFPESVEASFDKQREDFEYKYSRQRFPSDEGFIAQQLKDGAHMKKLLEKLVVEKFCASTSSFCEQPTASRRAHLIEMTRAIDVLANKKVQAKQQVEKNAGSGCIAIVGGDEFDEALEELFVENKLRLNEQQLFVFSSLLDQLWWRRELCQGEYRVLVPFASCCLTTLPELSTGHVNVNQAIASVYLQANKLKMRGYTTEASKAQVLAESLQQSTDEYFILPSEHRRLEAVVQKYKSSCGVKIKYAQNVLAGHRGTQKVLANVLYAVMGLGVGYGAVVAARSLRVGRIRFFNAPTPTKTEMVFQETQKVLYANVNVPELQPVATQLVVA